MTSPDDSVKEGDIFTEKLVADPVLLSQDLCGMTCCLHRAKKRQNCHVRL